MSTDQFKKIAAAEAVKLVRAEMVLGLGTGSTAAHFIDLVGEKARAGMTIMAIPSSEATRRQALAAGIEIIEPDETTIIDLAIDGADEIDPDLNLIKGGGGALLREKIIAEAAREFVVIADASKNVSQLGAFPLPVEIENFAWALTVRRIREVLANQAEKGADIALRAAPEGGHFMSDGGNLIADCKLARISDPAALDAALRDLPGVVETGLFVGLTDKAIIADETGARTITSRRAP